MSFLMSVAKWSLATAIIVAFAGVQSYIGYVHGMNSAPAPTTEFVKVPVPVPVERKYDAVMVVGATEDGKLVHNPETTDGLLYLITVSMMGDGGLAHTSVLLDYGDAMMNLTLRIPSGDFHVKVERIEGAVPKIAPRGEPEDDAPGKDEDDF